MIKQRRTSGHFAPARWSAVLILSVSVICSCFLLTPRETHAAPGTSPGVVSKPFLLPNVVYYGGVSAKNVSVPAGPAKLVINLDAPATGKNAWDEAAQEKLPVAVARGDVLLVTFFIRALRPAVGAQVVFNTEAGPPAYHKSVSQVIAVTTQWKKVVIPFRSLDSLPAGASDFDFFLDTVPQTVQIAGFQVVDYGKAFRLSVLHKSGY